MSRNSTSLDPLGLIARAAMIVVALVVGAAPGCRQKRTAPSPEPAPAGVFTDVTASAGIRFRHDNGGYGRKLFPEIMGSGGAFFDADGDGFLDVFLVNSSPLPGHPKPKPQPSRLYLNRGDGSFRDATAGSGLESPGYGQGVATGDVDSDGRVDLYVTRVGKNSLFRNLGGGKFADITAAAGVAAGGFSSSAAFLDYDNDGNLDLYVCRYVDWESLKDDYRCLNPAGKKQYCDVHVYDGKEQRLYRNLGKGRFQDVTKSAGLAGKDGRALAVVSGDYDRDGNTDLFVACDESPNFLWQNQGNGKFIDAAPTAGFAYNERGKATAGMGLDIADADGDGSDDVIEADFQDERKTLYLNDGAGFFTPNGGQKGLGDMSLSRLTFGIGFLDYDLDGWQDILLCNGHVIDDIEQFSPGTPYAQTSQLFRNLGGGTYEDRSAALGDYSTKRFVGRGAAFGDFDNDGDTDVLFVNNNGPAALLRNDLPHRNHWLGIDVKTAGGAPNLGARVTVTIGKRVLTDEVRTASSYLSASDPRLLFGLGEATSVDKVEIRRLNGKVETHRPLGVDRYVEMATPGD